MKLKKLVASNLDTLNLVCGVGINVADYDVTKTETIEVNGRRKRKMTSWCELEQTSW